MELPDAIYMDEHRDGWRLRVPRPVTEQYLASWLACECQADGPTQREWLRRCQQAQQWLEQYSNMTMGE